MIPTTSPPSIADIAACNGSSEPLARSTRMPPMARLSWPTSGTSNTSFLPRKRTVRPLRATTMAIAAGVEVAAMVADEDRRALGRDVLDPGDVEAGVGHQLGAGELQRHLLQLDAEHRDLDHAR